MAAAQRLVAIKNHLEAPVLSQSAASFAAPLASAPTAAAVQRSDEEAVGIGAPLYDQTSYEKIRAEVDAFNAKFGAAPWERPAGSMTL